MQPLNVDIVVLWVDGNDPKWQSEKRKYIPKDVLAKNVSANRFRDWDVMQYWFRAVETYMPWVRTIHFVTYGHLPGFLKTDHPKLHIVRHEEFMPNDALPCFSSPALEANIWRIHDLADHFIYFNDDIFPAKPLAISDYFDEKTHLPKMQYREMPLRFTGYDNPWETTAMKDLAVVNNYIKKQNRPLRSVISRQYKLSDNIRNLAAKVLYSEYFVGFKIYHSEAPMLKQTFADVWEKEENMLTALTYRRFRSEPEVNQWLFTDWQLASGQFSHTRDTSKLYFLDTNTIEEIKKDFQSKKYRSICLEDPDYEIDFEQCKEML